jgi:hypothetical protein
MAEKHAEANRVVDSSKTILQLDQEDTYCPCCQMPYVDDTHKYSLCADNNELGELGPGFPLFFQFQKYLSGLMLLLSIVYFLPCAKLMYEAYDKMVSNGAPEKMNPLTVFSFGAFMR